MNQNLIKEKLKDLNNWPQIDKYRSYFILLPGLMTNEDIKTSVQGLASRTSPNTMFPYNPYNIERMDLYFEYIDHSKPTKCDQNSDVCSHMRESEDNLFDSNHRGDRNNAICMLLDGALVSSLPPSPPNPDPRIDPRFQEHSFFIPGSQPTKPLVYLPIAEHFESGFIEGLVTRLVLGQCKETWKLQDLNLDVDDSSKDLPIVDVSHFVPVVSQYFPGTSIVQQPLSFDQFMNIESTIHPVEPSAITLGWRAGDDLERTGNEKYREDVIALIHSRFSPREIGTMVGYTLSYMYGFAKCQHLLHQNTNFKQNKLEQIQYPTYDVRVINERITQELGMQEQSKAALEQNKATQDQTNGTQELGSSELITNFQKLLTLELYGLSQGKETNERQIKLGMQIDFINGFNVGSLGAYDKTYTSLYHIAYNSGYNSGYMIGYQQGYLAGYSAGTTQAWSQAYLLINQLQGMVNIAVKNGSGQNGLSLDQIVGIAQLGYNIISLF